MAETVWQTVLGRGTTGTYRDTGKRRKKKKKTQTKTQPLVKEKNTIYIKTTTAHYLSWAFWLSQGYRHTAPLKLFRPSLVHYLYSHYSWPMTLNKQWPRTMVWASLPVQLSNTSVKLVWRESVKNKLSTTPLNSIKQVKSWQRKCIETRHMKTLWVLRRSC